jgi:hypothetical protein
MEVHHHPNVEKKNFKEYLLEGLMIFLAVTMGFFAEGLRENITNKEKENQYVTSLLRDLEKDRSDLAFSIKDNKGKIRGLDSLLSLAGQDMNDINNRKLMYRYVWGVSYYSAFSSNDATMTQLKSSGGLQFIRHGHLADSIANYDQEIRDIYGAQTPYVKFSDDATQAMVEIIVFGQKKGTTDYPLVTTDPKKLEVFFNKVALERGWTQNYVRSLQGKVPYNAKLIALLKKEYSIK